ncbi:MAG: group III truncated hemoglobin [Sphingopyxis sp.]|nr:group III truncated hemoglobin [Sphingopyxis sp.]
MSEAADLLETNLRPLIEEFYGRVRADPELGPVFSAAVVDWDEHHARLADFWSSVLFASGRYKGNPVAIHLLHAEALTPAMFERWLGHWSAVAESRLAPATAALLRSKAERIAESLRLAVTFRRPAA